MTDDAGSKRAKPRPSIKDVAALAGVSWRTVSNVIHGHRYLRPETKAKVEDAIAELGYKPQTAARQLRTGRSNLITLAIPYIDHPYFASLAHAVVEAAKSYDYTVLIDETRGLAEKEVQVARGYQSSHSDGIIFSPLTLPVDSILAARDKTPLVLLGEHTLDPRIDHVTADNVESTREATEHLISLGHRRIAFLGYLTEGTLGTGDLRLKGYRRALAAAEIDEDPDLIIGAATQTTVSEPASAESDYSREEGYARAQQILLLRETSEIDAVVCANDLLAIGLLRAFREAGVNVPGEVAVTGWDNTPEGGFSAPTLTTVAPDMDAIARFAIEAVHRRILGSSDAPIGRVAPHRLVIRESTAGGLL
ncbi:LacI family DNA-binding transcriptional regulator [Brevibacterium sp. UCMA 11754]|uniref:LacI family DNA-binding transcriptional regulator n=1 Tax=Brevibacterium sp. UCMA 11754 TaxID=2749198 RepID=UPI001F321B16|nr:LacI family DNA-binding transcriptional regulator [Brevibacterium sp. UCMA 11754]MCF2572883.1 LacI family DNA-binding transcriptional regulator [Brevibacterium sp. UCMA 11754]